MTCWCIGPKIRIVLNGEEIVNVDLADWKDPVNNPDGTPLYENTVQYAILKKEWKPT